MVGKPQAHFQHVAYRNITTVLTIILRMISLRENVGSTVQTRVNPRVEFAAISNPSIEENLCVLEFIKSNKRCGCSVSRPYNEIYPLAASATRQQ